MRYPYYQHPELFEPSLATLKFWLNTRKSKTTKGGGLFETDRFTLDRNWFVIAFLIELAAFFLTIWGGYLKYANTHKSKILILAVIASVLFVLLDYFGVLMHHKGSDDRTVAKSKLNYAQDPLLIGELKKQGYPKFVPTQFVGFLCIFASAILKISALVLLISFLKKIAPVITIFYLIVMYVHLKHTGYWYFSWRTSKRINTEFQEFQKNKAIGMPSEFTVKKPPHRIEFLSYFKLNETILCLNDRVRVRMVGSEGDSGKTKFHYELTCIGVLWDEDIVNVTKGFSYNIQQDLYEACIKIQHAQLGAPVAHISTPNVIADSSDEA